MELADAAGLPLSGASAEALAHYEAAARQLRCYVGDPLGSVDKALQADPGMAMALAFKAWLHLIGTEPSGHPLAQECLRIAKSLRTTDRERRHFRAIELVLQGHWRAAARVLEDLGAEHPTDGLALQVGHRIDLLVGDARMLRDRIARALPAWSPALPGYHAVLGMYAFGLAECGEGAAAEQFGRRAVALEPRDGWAWHAVAHALEMQNRPDEGVAWLRSDSGTWAHQSFFAVHNWWHLALFHIERGETQEALRLFDGPVFGTRSRRILDLVDASSLLWRLHLLGVDVGSRWQAVADGWEAAGRVADDPFNAWHAMMAFAGAGRERAQRDTLNALKVASMGNGDAGEFAREGGLDAARAVLAFAAGRPTEAFDLLRPLRHHAHRLGGSHAQRDLLDLTLIESAIRAGQGAMATALVAERAARRPRSAVLRRLSSRVTPPANS